MPRRLTGRAQPASAHGHHRADDDGWSGNSVWVRGYGLVDSAVVTSAPGRLVNFTATPAPDAAAAAQYYPAIDWYSMLRIPAADQFGSHPGISPNVTETRWLNAMKSNGC